VGRLLHWALTLPLFFALSAALIYGNAEKVHSKLLWLGEATFGGYFQIQRDPEPPPNCDELFSEGSAQEGAAAEGTGEGTGEAEADGLDDLFGEEEESPEAVAAREAAQAKARAKAVAQCKERAALYVEIQGRITPQVKLFRAIEGGVGAFVSIVLDHFKHILVLILLLGALVASAREEHIALRHPDSEGARRLADLLQAIAYAGVFASMWSYRGQVAPGEERTLNSLWLMGLGALGALHMARLGASLAGRAWVSPHHSASGEEQPTASLGRALLSIPLYATMALIASLYFIQSGHSSGLAIELTKLTEHAILYVNVALYVWVGMLLKQSPLTQLVFGLLRPWRFAPALLVCLVVVGAAIPTAYSGASGIFVIAAGALIYEELRAAGARRQLALAATAMSGSLGVVLSPCLLVVIIASLNKQVTTDELYLWGLRVFGLTAFLFSAVTLTQRDRSLPWMGAERAEAIEGTKIAFKALLPSIIWVVVVLAIYRLLLSTSLDEHSAPMMLPVLMLVLLTVAGRASKRGAQREPEGSQAEGPRQSLSVKRAVVAATSEAGPHIGALLALMGMSICLGGVVERAELMTLFPQSFGSLYLTMGALVLILVIVGMLMDPYGAVILVSATIADVAYRNGVNPIHFWVVVMVAFELGYLSPPVALNHLLTRQVVGDREVDEATREALEGGRGLWGRYERILLPVSVMGVALLLVAFLPLLFY